MKLYLKIAQIGLLVNPFGERTASAGPRAKNVILCRVKTANCALPFENSFVRKGGSLLKGKGKMAAGVMWNKMEDDVRDESIRCK